MARIAAQRALAAAGSQAERARYVPDVFIFGMHELHPSDLTILEPDWAVGVGASINLFDGFSREHRVAAARAREQRVELVEQRARRDIATLVEKRYRELLTARDQFTTLKQTQGLAEENLRVRSRAFEEGMGTSLDVVDARMALSRVELEEAGSPVGLGAILVLTTLSMLAFSAAAALRRRRPRRAKSSSRSGLGGFRGPATAPMLATCGDDPSPPSRCS